MTSISKSLQQLQALLDARRWGEARPLLEGLLRLRPAERAVLHALCEAEISDGAAQQALQRLEDSGARGEPEADFLHARALAALGHDVEARDALQVLRQRLPGSVANLELQLALVEERLGNLDAARDGLRRASQAAPQSVEAHLQLARIHARLGEHAQVRQSLASAVTARPATAAQWRLVGQLYADLFDWTRSSDALEQASALDPGESAVETLAAVAYVEQGEIERARAALQRACARDAGDLRAAVASQLILPPIYADGDDLLQCRDAFGRGLARLVTDCERYLPRAADVFALPHSNFLLAYQGGDDCRMQRDYSAFLARLTAAAAPDLHEAITPTYEGGRALRVGFASSLFRDCTIGRYFARWITALDPGRCERFVYHVGGIVDPFTERLAAQCEHFALLREGAHHAAGRIKADRLDVLVYPDVGMDAVSCVLATLRLAPVQLAGWGHPVTTGSNAIDGYITVDAMEPGDSAAHYTEPLVRLPMPGVQYARPEPVAADRAQLGLADKARIYACTQSLFKIHPDMDRVFVDVLLADPGAQLLFFEGTAPAITQRFAQRLQRAMSAHGATPRLPVKYLPRLPARAFRALVGACDVVLDTLHWSGGNTSFDALAMGTPVVTVPGRFMRGRQSMAMLQAIGLPELVAADAQALAALAVKVARDPALQGHLRERIARGSDALFEVAAPITALEDAMIRLAARR